LTRYASLPRIPAAAAGERPRFRVKLDGSVGGVDWQEAQQLGERPIVVMPDNKTLQ
jgi:hypothetical protein